MKVREPTSGREWFMYVWAAMFGGIPLFMIVQGGGGSGGPPLFLLLFPLIAAGMLVPAVRRSMRSGFHLEPDGIHGAHDAEGRVLPWENVSRLVWRWAQSTNNVRVNGKPAPDGYAIHAVLQDGHEVRLMQRVAAKYGQQQDLNEQLATAGATGALPVPFDATIPTREDGSWSGTPPAQTQWSSTGSGSALPPATDSPLDDGDDGPRWPLG